MIAYSLNYVFPLYPKPQTRWKCLHEPRAMHSRGYKPFRFGYLLGLFHDFVMSFLFWPGTEIFEFYLLLLGTIGMRAVPALLTYYLEGKASP
jgi:hypothetical protein